MKIVYVCNEINLKSGWAVLNYYTIINASQHFSEVVVFTLNNADNLDLSAYENIVIYPLLTSMHDGLFKYLYVFKDIIAIRKYINIKKIDIAHILVEPLLPLILVFNRSKKIYSIVGTYSIVTFKHKFNKFLYWYALKHIDRIVSISEYTKERFNNIFNHHIETIPLGVNNDSFQICCDVPIKEKAFVFVGHIKPRKGLIYALKAFKKIVKNYNDVKFYIVGAASMGKYAETCIKFVKEHELENQVIFLGEIDDQNLITIYRKSICNILTSVNEGEHFEGFGLIHLEANACGIPSIGSTQCGNESAIVDGITGYLCNQKDVEDIYSKMSLIIEDYEQGNFVKWEENCKKHAKQNDWKFYFTNLLQKVYKS